MWCFNKAAIACRVVVDIDDGDNGDDGNDIDDGDDGDVHWQAGGVNKRRWHVIQVTVGEQLLVFKGVISRLIMSQSSNKVPIKYFFKVQSKYWSNYFYLLFDQMWQHGGDDDEQCVPSPADGANLG